MIPKGKIEPIEAFPAVANGRAAGHPQRILPLVPSPPIIQRDDGRFGLGWSDDAPGPFESMNFAAAVAARRPATPPRSPSLD
jgi:hypothetical protein